jgi:hypothetical protein
MNELVERLTKGPHPIVAERSASPRELREQIERGFVLLKFPNTRGGTELGSRLDMEETRLDGADFEGGTGTVHLVGSLTLNYDKVQLVADIDLASLKGTGHLVLIEAGGSSQRARNNDAASNGSGAREAKDQNAVNDGEASAVTEADSQSTGKAENARQKSGPRKKKSVVA